MAGLDALLYRSEPTSWERFWASPALYLAQRVYHRTKRGPPTHVDEESLIRVVCISDTHNSHLSQPPLPEGDLLIHAGDLTHSGTPTEVAEVLAWLSSQPHAHKVVIAGNHDGALVDPAMRDQLLQAHPTLQYLEDAATQITVRGRTLRIYGSPRTPKNGGGSFHYPRARPDVLVTHGPPFAHLDLGSTTGCTALLTTLWRVRPRLHIFGHIHGARGVEFATWGRAQLAYEDVCRAKGGWVAFARLVVWTTVEKFGAWWNPSTAEGTILVNAAAVGGLRDEKRRGAIDVYI
ncbi:Metallophosphoesterase domain-containing protein 1 [Mycena venus]|uniref:Metallophosphoesterase domain-containing protein 1 n=1 Tax=Mycena venus TaxID=2733690 RepID=A0A8H6XG64_9AGAR|nr:Metallophosphoesterase domain-containing protein 1 [Mycena venus]